jgi:hypothetical protein
VQPQRAGKAECEAKSAELRRQWATHNELNAKTVAQLKALCGQHGVSKTGVKAELVARLCDTLCPDEPEPAAKRPRTVT